VLCLQLLVTGNELTGEETLFSGGGAIFFKYKSSGPKFETKKIAYSIHHFGGRYFTGVC